jgi:rhamnogalacturonyl hydrolase YesR
MTYLGNCTALSTVNNHLHDPETIGMYFHPFDELGTKL